MNLQQTFFLSIFPELICSTNQVINLTNIWNPRVVLVHHNIIHDVTLHDTVCRIGNSHIRKGTTWIVIFLYANTFWCDNVDIAQRNVQIIVNTITMIDELLELALRDTYTQCSQTCRIMLLTESHLHMGSMVAHPHLEGLWFSTDVYEIFGSLVDICLDRYSNELHILYGVAKVNLIYNIIIINLYIHNLRVDSELWLAAIRRIG